MTTVAPTGNTITIYTDNRHNPFSRADITPTKAVFDVEIKNPAGDVLKSDSFTFTEKIGIVSEHPEVPEGGFTRHGGWIEDTLQRFKSGEGLLYGPDSKAAKKENAKNLEGNPKLRIFDSIEDEQFARKMNKKIKTFFTETVEKFGITKKEAEKALRTAFKL